MGQRITIHPVRTGTISYGEGHLFELADIPEASRPAVIAASTAVAALEVGTATAVASSVAAEAVARDAAIAVQAATDSGTYVRKASKFRALSQHSLVPVAAAATISATSTQTLAKLWPSADATAGAGTVDGTYAYSGYGVAQFGTTGTRPTMVSANALSPSAALVSPLKVSFMLDGIAFEVRARNANGKYRVWVDDQLVSETAVSLVNDGTDGYTLVTLADKRPRRIDLELYNVPFGGIVTAATDSVWSAPLRGPRTIFVGDSFAEGTGSPNTGADCLVRAFGHALGWDEVVASPIGGTGYLNPGSYVKYRDRLAADVIAYAPEVVVWSGGINDSPVTNPAWTAAAVGAEASACFAAVTAALPNALQIVNGTWYHNGPESWPVWIIPLRDAVRAAALAAGCLFVDLLEMPLGHAAVSTTTSSGASAGATTIAGLAAPIPAGSTVSINNIDRRVITSRSGTGPYTITVPALTTAVPATPVTIATVGPALWSGTGRVGATTGAGNSDLYVSTDGVHPSQAGHNAIGTAAGRLLLAQLGIR